MRSVAELQCTYVKGHYICFFRVLQATADDPDTTWIDLYIDIRTFVGLNSFVLVTNEEGVKFEMI